MSSAHRDTFVRDRLPPKEQWPELLFTLPELQYPERINCTTAFLDERVAAGEGARVALRGADESYTYAELLAWVCRLSRVLVEDLGLIPGNRVLLRGGNNPTMAALWLAVARAGGVVVATMPLLRAKELGELIEQAQISHAICDFKLREELEHARVHRTVLEHVVYFRAEGERSLEAMAAKKKADFSALDTHAEDPVLVAFTSGTTGKPKGTIHFHRDILAVCDCFPRSTLKATGEDVFIGTPPLAFTFGLGGLLLFPLRLGATAVLLEGLHPEALLRAIENYRATVCFTAPTSYRQLAGLVPKFDVRSLRKCVSAGEALPAATRALWKQATGIEMIDGIGSTELLHIFVSHREEEARAGATGRAIDGYVAVVMDEHGAPVAPGSVGRLAVKGPTGCRYLADERQREYVRNGWNYTGDAYVMDEDGFLHYQSRTDDLIISAGYNIAGPEVEGALLQHPAVAECAVVGVPDEERGQLVKAFVVLKAGVSPGDSLVQELQQFVKEQIAPYKYPRAVEFRTSLPRTETGKLQRFRLRAEAGT